MVRKVKAWSWQQRAFYFGSYLILIVYGGCSLLVPMLVRFECMDEAGDAHATYSNPDYEYRAHCKHERLLILAGLSIFEADMIQRQLFAGFLGAVIGLERRIIDKPAGIRTMALVSLGACLFTICSMFSFLSGSMEWDSSRVSAAIPSGVGFLGAGLIWKGTVDNQGQVHGLTTAASVWLSAAVGVACGGSLHVVAAFGVILIILILRGFPRILGNKTGVLIHDGDSDLDIEEDCGDEIDDGLRDLEASHSQREFSTQRHYDSTSSYGATSPLVRDRSGGENQKFVRRKARVPSFHE